MLLRASQIARVLTKLSGGPVSSAGKAVGKGAGKVLGYVTERTGKAVQKYPGLALGVLGGTVYGAHKTKELANKMNNRQ